MGTALGAERLEPAAIASVRRSAAGRPARSRRPASPAVPRVEQDGKTSHDYEVIGNVELLTAPRNTSSSTSESEQSARAAA
jgi:hypothetical protein